LVFIESSSQAQIAVSPTTRLIDLPFSAVERESWTKMQNMCMNKLQNPEQMLESEGSQGQEQVISFAISAERNLLIVHSIK